jgi:hypothetical protein
MHSHHFPVNEVMSGAIMDLGDKGPEVLLYLSQHPHEAIKIAQMSPYKATMEIGFLSKSLANGSDTTPATPTTSQGITPKPVPQVRGSMPGSLDQQPRASDSTVEWAQKEAARMRAKFGQNLRIYVPK